MRLYNYGDGVEQSGEATEKWYTLATDQGNDDAQYNLATMYSQGDGVPVCDKTAAKWFTLAAKKGEEGPQY